METNSHIVVVEPSCLFREGLVRILGQIGSLDCSAYGQIDEIKAVPQKAKRMLFLVNFGRDWNATSAGLKKLREQFPESPVVVLSDWFSASHLIRSIKGGANGYLLNHMSCDALIKSIELALLGEVVFPTEVVRLLCEAVHEPDLDVRLTPASSRILSTREAEVLKCLSEGKSNKIIARQWGITEATVKVHVKAILRKVQVRNRTEAALWARDHGLSPMGELRQNVAFTNGNESQIGRSSDID